MTTKIWPLVLGFILFSFAFLGMSQEFYAIWKPMFPGVELGTIESRTALSIIFMLDLLLLALLIHKTGGSVASPFTNALFMLPALAIFLRESPMRFVLYALTAFLIFWVLLTPRFAPPTTTEENPNHRRSVSFVAFSCLAISMFIGYITRPVPIDEIMANAPNSALQVARCAPTEAELRKLEVPNPSLQGTLRQKAAQRP